MAWTAETRRLWEHFASLAKPAGLEPSDLQRLADFVVACHVADAYPDRPDLYHEMEEERRFAGVASAMVEEMLYEDGPLILQAYDRLRGE